MPKGTPALHHWLASDQGMEFLSLCARRILTQLPQDMYTPRGTQACLHEVINDVWIFLTTLSPAKKQDLARMASAGDFSKLVATMTRLFVCSCLDQRRTAASSPWHALYRRVRTLLSQTQDIAYASEANQTWYAWCIPAPDHRDTLQDQEFTSWPPPPISSREITRSAKLQEAARFFWHQAKKTSGQPCLVSVRSLVTYLGAHYPEQVCTPVFLSDSQSSPDQDNDWRQEWEDHSFSCSEHSFTAQRLPELAADFVAGLSALELNLWVLRFEQELGFQDIARELGLKNASGAHYHAAKLEKRFKKICILWPGLSPEDANQELAMTFLDLTLQACKEWIENRDQE